MSLLVSLLLVSASVARAQTLQLPSGPIIPVDLGNINGINILGYLGQACSLLKATWVCDLTQIVGMVDGLNKSGWATLKGTLDGALEGWLEDAVTTAGNNLCLDAQYGGGCLANFLSDAKTFLQNEPSKLFAYLAEQARKLYLSNLVNITKNQKRSPRGSPEYWAEEAIATSPSLRAKFLKATAESMKAAGKFEEAGKINLKSLDLLDPKLDQNSPYNGFSSRSLMPDCASLPIACDPTNPEGGTIARYKNRARTAVSTRELTQLMVELEADKIGGEILQTQEISRKMTQMTQAQVFTSQQLFNIYQDQLEERQKSQAKYQFELEQDLMTQYQRNRTNAGIIDTSRDIIIKMSDWTVFDGVIGRF
jgi:hypothetical protein